MCLAAAHSRGAAAPLLLAQALAECCIRVEFGLQALQVECEVEDVRVGDLHLPLADEGAVLVELDPGDVAASAWLRRIRSVTKLSD